MTGRTAAGGDGRAKAEGSLLAPTGLTHTHREHTVWPVFTNRPGWALGLESGSVLGEDKGRREERKLGRACDSCILVTLPESLMLYICVLYVIDVSTKTCVKRIHYQVNTPHRQEDTKE